MAGRSDYRMLDHTADLGFEVRGGSQAELFENAAWALFDQISDPDSVRPLESLEIAVEAPNPGELMHDWLSELLYLFEVKSMVFRSFSVKAASKTSLSASAAGEPFDPGRHGLKSIVKAVTRHMLCAAPDGPGWKAVVVCDV